jgi:ATP-dependent metalloprotease
MALMRLATQLGKELAAGSGAASIELGLAGLALGARPTLHNLSLRALSTSAPLSSLHLPPLLVRTPQTDIFAPASSLRTFREFHHYLDARLARLSAEARTRPNDPSRQALYISELGKSFPKELQKISDHQETVKSFIPANVVAAPPQPPGTLALNSLNSLNTLNSLNANRGSPSAPLTVVVADPGIGATLRGLAKSIMFALLLFAGLSAILDEATHRGHGTTVGHEVQRDGSVPAVKFTDVKGCPEAVDELRDLVLFLKEPARFNRLGGKMPKGVLLLGPPGTGKTLLARAVAGEAGVPFFTVSGSEFEEIFVGVGAKRVRDLFAVARKKAPCIIFIDEIDAVGGKRNERDQNYMKQTLNQLLTEMDGFDNKSGVIVLGATNFPRSLDPALIRAGRFDRQVVVPLPDVMGRTQILDLYLKQLPCVDTSVNTNIIARATTGLSGADLANLVNIAAIEATKEGLEAVEHRHLEFAADKVLMGQERKSQRMSDKDRRMTAYHEGGHTILAMFTNGAMPLHKVTIIPRGQSLGMTKMIPDGDVVSTSRMELLARMDVAMGGKVAEELIFGEEAVSGGCSSDLEHAKSIARDMVLHYGMTKVGPVSFAADDMRSLSDQQRTVIDKEINELLASSYERTKSLLKLKLPELHLLALALLERESLTAEECKQILSGKPLPPMPLSAGDSPAPPPPPPNPTVVPASVPA